MSGDKIHHLWLIQNQVHLFCVTSTIVHKNNLFDNAVVSIPVPMYHTASVIQAFRILLKVRGQPIS